VFGNLLKNAVLHSEPRDIHIELFEHGFSIQDFGHGISNELKDDLFQRTINGCGKVDQSNGIGLSLVKRLCDHFAWQLTVESSPGVGTTITVIFES
jgi:signal transduction histidine kinase